jgi:hypothetical protein
MEVLPRLGEYYRSDPPLVCSGSSPELRRAGPGAQLSPAQPQVEWCACSLRGTVQALLSLPNGSQQNLEGRRSLAYSTCYNWTYPLGPRAARGSYQLVVNFRDGELRDAFTLATSGGPQALWLEQQNLIWAGGFQPGESVRLLVFAAPAVESLTIESAYTLLYQYANTTQANVSGELWIDPGSPAISAAYRLVVFVGASGRGVAGRGISPGAAQILTGHLFNDCAGNSTSLRVGKTLTMSAPRTEIFLSSLLLDDEVLDTLLQGEEVALQDGPMCDQGGWRWKVSARKGALQGWMPETSLIP